MTTTTTGGGREVAPEPHMKNSLPSLISLAVVAHHFGVSPRTIKLRIKEHGIPVVRPSCRVVLFDEIALIALTEALRPCPSASSSGQTAPIGGSPAPSGGSAYAKVLALTMRPRPKKPVPYGKRKLSAKLSTAGGA